MVDFVSLEHCSAAESSCMKNMVTLVSCSATEPSCMVNLVGLELCSAAEPSYIVDLVGLLGGCPVRLLMGQPLLLNTIFLQILA
jgi:hypothetical protein